MDPFHCLAIQDKFIINIHQCLVFSVFFVLAVDSNKYLYILCDVGLISLRLPDQTKKNINRCFISVTN